MLAGLFKVRKRNKQREAYKQHRRDVRERTDRMLAEMLGSTNPNTTKFSAEKFMRMDVRQLQRLAADTMWSSPHAKGALQQLSVLSMGSGLRLQSLPNRLILGLESKEAHELARQFEAYFDVVRHQVECSHDGTRTYNGVELQGFWSWLLWDEVFLIHRYKTNFEVSPLSVEVVNPARVQTPPHAQGLPQGHTIDQGIERNAQGKHVAFWLEVCKPGTSTVEWERVPYYAPGGRRIGVHTFRTFIPGQIRGTTRFIAVFHEMQRIQEALQLEVDTMNTNARLAAVWERDQAVNNPNKMQDIVDAGGDLSAIEEGLFGGGGNPGVAPLMSDSGGIIIQSAEPGEKLTPFDSKRPNVNVNEFITGIMTWIGPAIGIPIELWRALFGKSYSASKGSIDLGYKSFEVEVFQYSSGSERHFYEAVVAGMVARGYVSLPLWGDPLMRAAYLRAQWSGPPKPALNPFQEEKAASERVLRNRSSNEREIQQASGTSFDVVADRREYELEREWELAQIAMPEDDERLSA